LEESDELLERIPTVEQHGLDFEPERSGILSTTRIGCNTINMAMGLPIGSGVVEGTCKNLINDRMERSGTRWSPDGAEAILKLHSLDLTDLWNDFWIFRTQREKEVLYDEQGITPNQLVYHQGVGKAS
jgi:hypothetical protein